MPHATNTWIGLGANATRGGPAWSFLLNQNPKHKLCSTSSSSSFKHQLLSNVLSYNFFYDHFKKLEAMQDHHILLSSVTNFWMCPKNGFKKDLILHFTKSNHPLKLQTLSEQGGGVRELSPVSEPNFRIFNMTFKHKFDIKMIKF